MRRREDGVVAELVDRYGSAMVRLARVYVGEQPIAEDVVQEAWISVLRGIDRFEGRSSLKTWIFRILVNTAMTHARREGRTVPFSALASSDEPSVDAEHFLSDSDAWAGHWSRSPRPLVPEEHLLTGEMRGRIADAIRTLPPAQRAVLGLRDVEGWSAEDTCELLELTPVHQRVLLHRARSGVRQQLAPYVEQPER